MPLSQEDQKRHGCWLCQHYQASDPHLPLLPRDCFPCNFHKISKGPYDKPCPEGFELNEVLLETARELFGSLVDSRLGLRQEATSIRIKQGTHEFLEVPVDMHRSNEAIYAEGRRGRLMSTPEPRSRRLSESKEKSTRDRKRVPMADKYGKPLRLSDMLRFHQAPMVELLRSANPSSGKIDGRKLSSQTKQMLDQLVLAKAIEQSSGKKPSYVITRAYMHYLKQDLERSLLDEGLIPGPGLYILPELPESLRLSAFQALQCANGDNTIRTLDLQDNFGQDQRVLHELKRYEVVRLISRNSRWHYLEPYLAWAKAYQEGRVSEAQMASALGLDLKSLGLEADQLVTEQIEPVQEERHDPEGEEGKMGQTSPAPYELPVIPTELREKALCCLLHTGSDTLYVKMQQAGITSADLPALAEAGVVRLNKNQPYIRRGYTKVVRMYLKGEVTAEDLACWVGLTGVGEVQLSKGESERPVEGGAVEEMSDASLTHAASTDDDDTSVLISDKNGSHQISLSVAEAILDGLNSSSAEVAVTIEDGNVLINFGETILRLPLAT